MTKTNQAPAKTFEEQLADDIAAGRAIHAEGRSRWHCECTNQEMGWDLAQEGAGS